MAQLVDGVINVLSNLQVALSSSCELVVERMRQIREFILRYQVVGNATHLLDRTVIKEIPHALPGANTPELLAQTDVVGELLFGFVPLRILMRAIDRPFRYGVRFGLVHEVGDPSGNRLNQDLCAFAFEELEHVEVAVT